MADPVPRAVAIVVEGARVLVIERFRRIDPAAGELDRVGLWRPEIRPLLAALPAGA